MEKLLTDATLVLGGKEHKVSDLLVLCPEYAAKVMEHVNKLERVFELHLVRQEKLIALNDMLSRVAELEASVVSIDEKLTTHKRPTEATNEGSPKRMCETLKFGEQTCSAETLVRTHDALVRTSGDGSLKIRTSLWVNECGFVVDGLDDAAYAFLVSEMRVAYRRLTGKASAAGRKSDSSARHARFTSLQRIRVSTGRRARMAIISGSRSRKRGGVSKKCGASKESVPTSTRTSSCALTGSIASETLAHGGYCQVPTGHSLISTSHFAESLLTHNARCI